MIVIFGAPGSGKTTQVLKLAKSLQHVQCEVEPTDGVQELVADMYAEKPSAAFNLQMHVLKQRSKVYYEHQKQRDKLLIVDGHINSDYLMFVTPHYAAGNIAGEEKKVYEEQFWGVRKVLGPDVDKIDVFIFLDANPDVTTSRIASRDSLAEANVKPAVFADLVTRARTIPPKFVAPKVFTVDANLGEDQVHEQILAILKPLIDARHFPAVEPT